MDEKTNGPQKKRDSRRSPGGRGKKGRQAEETNPGTARANQYFEPEIHHAPFKDKSRRPLSSEALEDFEMDGE